MEQCTNVYRKMLTAGISSILIALGADAADRDILETLTEMFQCCKYINSYRHYRDILNNIML